MGIDWKNELKKKKNHDPTTYWLSETHFRFKDTNGLKVKRQKKTYHAKVTKRVRVTSLI